MAKITKNDVLKLAELARLKLSEDEVSKFTDEFTSILEYVEQLSDADTEGLKPTYQVSNLKNAMRSDDLIDYQAEQADLLKNVPKITDGQIEAPRMIA